MRFVALLLLAWIAPDVALDRGCDPLRLPDETVASSLQAPDGRGGDEACGDLCVPDCFCCSRSLPGFTIVVTPRLAGAVEALRPVAARLAAGERPVPYHPPLA